MVHPNPGTGVFQLATGTTNDHLQVEVFKATGERISQFDLKADRTLIDLSREAKGLYFVTVSSGTQRSTRRLVKE